MKKGLTRLAFLTLLVCLILLVPSERHPARAAPPAQGTGSITGHVYEADGTTPIDNLRVWAEDYDTGESHAGIETGPDGSYTLTDLSSGDYRVGTCPSCTGQTYVPEYYHESPRHHEANRVTVTEPGTTTGIDFTLDPAGIVTGRVTEEGGAPIENLHIAAIRVSDDAWFGGPNTDASGYYTFTEVPATDVYIYACSGCNDHPYVDEYYDDSLNKDGATVLSISAGITTPNVDFALTVGGSISGYVRDEHGAPIADANVHADDFDGNQWGRGTNTQADGSYTITGLPSGDYRVRANAEGHLEEYYQETFHWEWAERVSVTAPGTTSSINFTLEQGDATIQGRVRYGDGSPVADVQVEGNRWHGHGWAYTHTDASGAYALPVSAGNWVVHVPNWEDCFEGHTMEATPLIAIASGETVNDIDITLLPNDATVSGVVRQQDDTPIPYARVALPDETTGWELGRQVTSDASGAYTLSVPAGTWRINAWHDDYISPSDQQVTVGTGETANKDLYLSALNSSISGRVLDQHSTPVPNAWVWGWHAKEPGGNGVHSQADGSYTLPVYAGVWHIHAEYPPNYTNVNDRAVLVTEGQNLSGVDLRLNKATAVVRGTVRLGSYTGPPTNVQADTHVDSRERGEWIHHQTIKDTGIYTSGVTAGQWDAYVHLEGYTCKESRWLTVNDGDDVSADVVLLRNTAIIKGSISDQYGFPVPNAHVEILDGTSWRNMIPWHLGWADSAGNYTLGVAAGTWRVCVWRDGYDSPDCPEIAIADGETRTLNLVLQSRISAIDGTVTDLNPNPGDNVPLEGATVQLWDEHGVAPLSDSDGPLVGDTTDPDGRFDFSLGIDSGPYLVRAFKEGYSYGQALIYALGGRHSAGTIRLPAETGGTLSGQVTDGGSPVPDAVVVVRQGGSQNSAFAQDGSIAQTRTDSGGNYAFGAPFAPGEYAVVVSAVGYEEATRAITITAGADTVAHLALTATSVPAYGVAYLTSNRLDTVGPDREYPALVQVHNVGTQTWISTGDDAVQFHNEWRDSGGDVHKSWTLAGLPYDVPPDGVIFFPVSSWTPIAGEYTLEWGLWHSGDWLAETQVLNVSVPAGEVNLPNLYIREADISTNPPTVREGNTFDVLVFVHNDSDEDANNVTVQVLADGDPFGAGRYTLQSVPRRSTVQLRAAGYAPLSQSLHVISVRIDPDEHIAESNENDNSASKVIEVFPPSSDPIAPSGTITINNGALTTDSTSVELTLSAQDNDGGTGVQHMYITEFVFDAAAGQWRIIQESDWIDYATNLDWTVSPSGGVKHFQVRYADGAWNISDAALAWINYTPECDTIALAEWKLYQWRMREGDEMTTTVTPCGGQGDPDLYVWIGPSGGSPHYYSTNAGVAPDTVALTASETGEYNFWVYGFEGTTFNLTMDYTAGGAGASALGQGTRILAEAKSLPQAPPSTIESPTYVPATPVWKVLLFPIFMNWQP